MGALPKIKTEFWMKPIPLRQFDWLAFYDGDEPNDNGSMPHGEGRTEAEAVVDLIENHPRGIQCERDFCGVCGGDRTSEAAERCRERECPIDHGDCTCRLETVHSASIDPPEMILNPWCPRHGGRDPDAEYEQRRDDAPFFEAMGWDGDDA